MILIICGIELVADLCVTVSGILKINKKLEMMEEIAAELHRLSDQMGENIYQNVMEGVERQEALKKKREEYQQKYAHYLEHSSQTGRRMLRAFPKMQSKLHHEIWEELREKHDHLHRKK